MPSFEEIRQKFDELLFKYRHPLIFLLLGLILLGLGVFLAKNQWNLSSNKIEVLEDATEGQSGSEEIVVEVAGAVEKPGVYRMKTGDRVDDVLIIAGGISAGADRLWMEKFLNRAAKIIDGQKIYIPKTGEYSSTQSQRTLGATAKNDGDNQSVSVSLGPSGEGLININNASQKELESLPGIGPVYAQNIIEQRPYSNVDELLTKAVLRKSTYEKIKEKVTIY